MNDSLEPGKVTLLLEAVCKGVPQATSELLPLVYDELRQMAVAKLAQEAPGQTLQGTALVHEAYLRLVDGDPHKKWDGRSHFIAAAAEAMRRILVEKAREKKCQKRGANLRRCEIEPDQIVGRDDAAELLLVNDLLTRLEAAHPQAAQVVKLRVFVGMTVTEAAEAMGVGRRTVDSLWAYGRAWLLDQRRTMD